MSGGDGKVKRKQREEFEKVEIKEREDVKRFRRRGTFGKERGRRRRKEAGDENVK